MTVRYPLVALEKDTLMINKVKMLSLAMLLLSGTAAHSAVVWSDEFNGTEILLYVIHLA